MKSLSTISFFILILASYSCDNEIDDQVAEVALNSIPDSNILWHPEEHPEAIGGMMNLYERLKQELQVPPLLSERAKVFIQFSLDTEGNITETTVIKGLNEAIDEEALRAFSAIGVQFTPAKINGQPYATKMVLPVVFDPENRNEE